MDKFTKIQNRPPEVDEEQLYQGELDVVRYKETEILKSGDAVAILPYFIDEASILMRLEYLPAYQYKNKENQNLKRITNYLTVITGGIEKNENPISCVRRELYEEGGITMSNLFDFKIEGPYFSFKYGTAQIYPVILELKANHYKQIKPPTDGSKGERLSKNIRVSLGDIDQIICNDLITKYLIEKFKSEYLNDNSRF